MGVTVTLSDFAREHQLALTRFAFLLGGDRHYAEDVVQDVLTAMFRRFGDVLPVANPVAYARAAVVNALEPGAPPIVPGDTAGDRRRSQLALVGAHVAFGTRQPGRRRR